jgi:hypothetical protein
LDKRQFLSVF